MNMKGKEKDVMTEGVQEFWLMFSEDQDDVCF